MLKIIIKMVYKLDLVKTIVAITIVDELENVQVVHETKASILVSTIILHYYNDIHPFWWSWGIGIHHLVRNFEF